MMHAEDFGKPQLSEESKRLSAQVSILKRQCEVARENITPLQALENPPVQRIAEEKAALQELQEALEAATAGYRNSLH